MYFFFVTWHVLCMKNEVINHWNLTWKKKTNTSFPLLIYVLKLFSFWKSVFVKSTHQVFLPCFIQVQQKNCHLISLSDNTFQKTAYYWFRYLRRSFSISNGSVVVAWRATGFPSLFMMNLVKFHFMKSPKVPPCLCLR